MTPHPHHKQNVGAPSALRGPLSPEAGLYPHPRLDTGGADVADARSNPEGPGSLRPRHAAPGRENNGRPAPRAREKGAVIPAVSKTDRFRLGMRCSTSAGYAGKLGLFSPPAVKPTCFQQRSIEIYVPRPLGGEGGLQPAFSSAGAGRVRGSKALGPTEILSTLMPFHFCLLPLLWLLRRTNSILVKTPSPPALRSPLSPKGARGNVPLVSMSNS